MSTQSFTPNPDAQELNVRRCGQGPERPRLQCSTGMPRPRLQCSTGMPHKKPPPPPQERHRSLGMVLLQGPAGLQFLMSEVPL